MNNAITKTAAQIALVAALMNGTALATNAEPLARYSFNEGRGTVAIDQTGYGADATLNGSASFGSARFGSGIDLDGNGHLTVDTEFHRPRTNAGAVSVWVNVMAGSRKNSRQYIVSRIDQANNAGFALYENRGLIKGEIYFAQTGHVTVSTADSVSGWAHIALAHDPASSTLTLYVNGMIEDQVSVITGDSVVNADRNLTIGALSADSAGSKMRGHIDELQLFDSLTGSDVMQLATAPGGEPGLLFYESFDSIAAISASGEARMNGLSDADDIVAGRFGNALRLQDAGETTESLSWPAAGKLDASRGEISFWYRPDFGPEETTPQTFFETTDRGAGPGMRIYRCTGCSKWPNEFRIRLSNNYHTATKLEPQVALSWQANEWRHISVSWDLTATDTAQRYIAYAVDGTVADVKTGIASLGTGTLDELFIGSSINSSGMNGTIDELKIYAAPTANMSTEDIDERIEILQAATRGNGTLQPHETVYNSGDAKLPENSAEAQDWQSQDSISFFRKSSFERVYAGYLPTIAELSDTLHYESAQGDNESMFFNVYSKIDDSDVTMSLGDLRDASGNIIVAAEDMTIRAVKNWWQRTDDDGTRLLPYFPVWVPELLMYDDRVNFKYDDYDVGTPVTYSPTNLPSDTPPAPGMSKTYLRAWTSKQFMVGLRIPTGIPGGTYTMTATLNGADSGAHRTVTLQVNVMDFALPVADKDFTIYHRAQYTNDVAWYETNDKVTEEKYVSELHDILDHGFNGLHAYGNSVSYIDHIYNAGTTNQNGSFSNKVFFKITQANADFSAAAREKLGEAWFAGFDEAVNDTELAALRKHAEKAHNANGKVGAAIYLHMADCVPTEKRKRKHRELSTEEDFCLASTTTTSSAQTLDYENVNVYQTNTALWGHELSLSPTQDYFEGLLQGASQKDAAEQSYYWQARSEDPRVNRYYAGAHLFITDMAGIWPYAYMHNDGGDPYNDFDIPAGYKHRDMNAVYPTREGVMTTMQWESMREGIDDYRHLQLWASLYQEMLSSDPAEAARSKQRIEFDPETGLGLEMFKYRLSAVRGDDQSIQEVTIADFNEFRRIVAEEIIALSGSSSTPPAEEETPPAEEETPPTEEETPPAEEETPPAEEETPPTEEETPPAEEETPPAEEETPPAEEETPPAEEEPTRGGKGKGKKK